MARHSDPRSSIHSAAKLRRSRRQAPIRVSSALQSTGNFKKPLGKACATLVVSAVLALVRNPLLVSGGWAKIAARLTGEQLIWIFACAPVAWLLVEFVVAFFGELSRLAHDGGVSVAGMTGQIPRAFINVLERATARVKTFLVRWNFERRYRRRLYEDYALFNDRSLGLINPTRLDLEKVYVDLQISNQIAQPRGELLQKPVTGRGSIWSFLQLIRPGSGLVLLGAPGSGKTTLLQYLLLVFATKRHSRYQQRFCLPIFVELRTLRELFEPSEDKKPLPTLAAAIRLYWQKNSRVADLMKEEPPHWLEHRLAKRRVLLLLDGLDEVAQAVRPLVSKWVHTQMRHEGNRRCQFVITSRPGGYLSAPIDDQTVLEIQPFSKEQINKFIESWYLANELVSTERRKDETPIRRNAAKEANDLRDRLRENQNLQDLAVNPLLLTMLCMVHRYHGALPGSRSQLYDEICQVLLERWRQGKGLGDELNGEQKLSVLRPLAHEFMLRETRELGEEEVGGIISKQLEYVGYVRDGDIAGVGRFVRSIQASSGLLLEKVVVCPQDVSGIPGLRVLVTRSRRYPGLQANCSGRLVAGKSPPICDAR
jgi:hypothetical protein